MFGIEKKQEEKKAERFIIKESHTVGLCSLSVICDTKTGVNYLATAGDSFNLSSMTPLLDHNGNVVIDPIGPQY